MSYARSPLPSLVITVGIRCISLPPRDEADWPFRSRRWIRHRKISAEVSHATQCFEGKRRRGEAKLGGWVVRPGADVGVGTEQSGQVRVQLGRRHVEGVSHGEQALGGHLFAAA